MIRTFLDAASPNRWSACITFIVENCLDKDSISEAISSSLPLSKIMISISSLFSCERMLFIQRFKSSKYPSAINPIEHFNSLGLFILDKTLEEEDMVSHFSSRSSDGSFNLAR